MLSNSSNDKYDRDKQYFMEMNWIDLLILSDISVKIRGTYHRDFFHLGIAKVENDRAKRVGSRDTIAPASGVCSRTVL